MMVIKQDKIAVFCHPPLAGRIIQYPLVVIHQLFQLTKDLSGSFTLVKFYRVSGVSKSVKKPELTEISDVY